MAAASDSPGAAVSPSRAAGKMLGFTLLIFFTILFSLTSPQHASQCSGVISTSCGSSQCCAVLESMGGEQVVHCSGFGPFTHDEISTDPNLNGINRERQKILQISSGGFHSCALFLSKSVVCFGANFSRQLAVPTKNKYRAISSGYLHTCGLTESLSVVCWGGDTYGQCAPPPGNFVAVGSGACTSSHSHAFYAA
jgi:hypothetical protein